MQRRLFLAIVGAILATAVSAAQAEEPARIIRVGIIGLDTSHVIAFTNLMNAPNATGILAEVEVVAGYPGGTDISASASRVEGYTKQLRERGIEIFDSIEAMLEKVDAVMLESVDGRPHLEQARPVIAAGKPLYIDKPMAGSLRDVIEIARLAKEKNVPVFSSSSTRFSSGVIGLRGGNEEIGEVRGCAAFGPCSIEKTHPDLFWYGVHGMEILYTIMGPGCERVTRIHTPGTDVVVGVWKDGRVGTFRGIRDGRAEMSALVFGSKAIAPAGKYEGYGPLVEQIAQFFKTGKPPVEMDETVEMFAFMEAADESKRQGGVPVNIADVMKAAAGDAR